MSLANDYFLLYHGITFEQDLGVEKLDISLNQDNISILALLLSTTKQSFEKYLFLESFLVLFEKLNINNLQNSKQLYHLQHNIIEHISHNISDIQIETIHNSFGYLESENIITNSEYTKLLSLFTKDELTSKKEIDTNTEKISSKNLCFNELKDFTKEITQRLEALTTLSQTKDEYKQIVKYLETQKFSIGITGVMNAGKSTMLNALMGEELLGSAVVPETANLSIVKYSKEKSAKVVYWNKKEWERIETSANEIKSIDEFIKDTKKSFGNSLDEYIQENSRVENIDIKDLSLYTSAEKSNKKCNLVKYVELNTNLEFLKDGIQIVDTPGLDDPVIQREEITKEYLSSCDMLIHLMNVSQSATLKDVEFIIDALLYQNISKLLIVITRADTVDKTQLNEVINYTKESIKQQLQMQNKDSKLDFILKHIEFIPISGKMALLHKTNREKEALEAGYSLEDTNITKVEDYLFRTLFGKDSQKNTLLLQNVKTKLLKTLSKQKDSLNFELKLLSKSKDELLLEIENFKGENEKKTELFDRLTQDIQEQKTDAKQYIDSLLIFFDNELLELQNIIKQRVISDVRYSFEKTKKRPQKQRIQTIVQTAIKDGIIDIIRDYRYKFIKKSQSLGERCEQKYQDMGFELGHKNDNFSAREFFEDDFKTGFLTTNNQIIIQKISNAVEKSKSNKLNDLDSNITESLKLYFKEIKQSLQEKINTISSDLIDKFFQSLNEPLNNFLEKQKQDEEILQEQLENFQNNQNTRAEKSILLHKNLKEIDNIELSIKEI